MNLYRPLAIFAALIIVLVLALVNPLLPMAASGSLLLTPATLEFLPYMAKNGATPTTTLTPVSTLTPTSMVSSTPTPTGPPINTLTATATSTPSSTATNTPTATATSTPSSTATNTPTPTATNTPTPVSPLFATALLLDGVDDYATVPDHPSLDLGTGTTDDFTIETYFYVPDVNNSTIDFLTRKATAYSLYIIFSNTDPDRLIFFIYTDLINGIYIFHDTSLSVGWHHVAAVFDNEYTASEDLMVLYLDGNRVTLGGGFDLIPGTINSSSALNIGAAPVNPFVGWMEETRFSDTIRYSGVSYPIPTAAFVPDANTSALWHFDEVAGSTSFADSSGNNNTLTGQNGAQTGNP